MNRWFVNWLFALLNQPVQRTIHAEMVGIPEIERETILKRCLHDDRMRNLNRRLFPFVSVAGFVPTIVVLVLIFLNYKLYIIFPALVLLMVVFVGTTLWLSVWLKTRTLRGLIRNEVSQRKQN
jgi:hypothetical protein